MLRIFMQNTSKKNCLNSSMKKKKKKGKNIFARLYQVKDGLVKLRIRQIQWSIKRQKVIN